jgi:hypothetical protein
MLARALNKKLFGVLIDPMKTIDALPDQLKGVWQVVDLAGGQDHRLFRAKKPGSVEEGHVTYSESGLRRLKRGLEKAGIDQRFFVWPPEGDPSRAGLLPRLARGEGQFIAIPIVRPEHTALTGKTGLIEMLSAVLSKRTGAEVRDAVQKGIGGLLPLLSERVREALNQRVAGDETERPPTFVIAIDQAEELFRVEGREESATLLALLADLAKSKDVAVIVIFGIRSDSYDALENAKALEGLTQVAMPLLPMPRGGYAEVIKGPARRVEEAGGKLKIEPALTERLLADIETGTGDALPLLAFTLEQLYRLYRQSGELLLKNYEDSGGLNGAIAEAVKRALDKADANPRIPRGPEKRLALLREGFIPWLVNVDTDSKTVRRNIARRADIPSESVPLIDLLVDERLLSASMRQTRDPTRGEDISEATVELTHEVLLRQWGLLDGWLKEDFALLTTLEGVRRAARDWDANKHDQSWLIHQGQRLAEARALDARPDIAARLDATDRAYLAGCRANAHKITRRTFVGAAVVLGFAAAAGVAYMGPIGIITTIAARSEGARSIWPRGIAPLGYIKGMALVFARVYLKLKAGNAAAVDMAKADTGDPRTDALAYYSSEFGAAEMSNAVSGADTLRHLFVLLIGLGMSETSGRYCGGMVSAENISGQTAESGLFQLSLNSMPSNPLLMDLFKEYSTHQSGFVEIFREEVRCSAQDFEVRGGYNEQEFQRLSKACPAFAVEYAAIGLRHIAWHWAPINRRQVQVRPECNAMLGQVQKAIDVWPGFYAPLVP